MAVSEKLHVLISLILERAFTSYPLEEPMHTTQPFGRALGPDA